MEEDAMRIANVAGRLTLRRDGGDIDVERASGGRFAAEPQAVFERWDEFRTWAEPVAAEAASAVTDSDAVGPPAPWPRQVFAIGLNYRQHAAESGHAVPRQPPTFTKYPSSLTGPSGDIVLPDGQVDWEVELVVVIGRHAHGVAAEDGWSHVAGLTVGQDISERVRQLAGPVPQFSLAKSFPGFGPTGPELVTPDEFADPDDLDLGCLVNGEMVQKGRTSDLIFPVPELIARLSAVVPLLPGDVVFTGTPAGVGLGRKPQRFLAPGDELVSYIEGIGVMRHRFVAPTSD
jgi:2-keto-4-pentenoate hydratase/2-oxohepta-3-ene-1,7-dioic acid hydratase in catechol pathway